MAESRDQRRLAAIVATDMVGYTRLMQTDESGTLARLRTVRNELIDPKIAEYGGRIVKTMGDGLLIEFASVVDAVESTIAIQRAMAEREIAVPEDRRIRFRAGINLGDIIIAGDDIFGTGVNVAARLQELSEPGGICISQSVHDQVRYNLKLSCEDIGEQEVKNIAEPIQVYRVVIDPEKGEERGTSPGETRRNRRWAVGAAIVACLATVGVVTWIMLDKESAVSSGSECTDHLGLPVTCP